MQPGVLPESQKSAIVTPILKKYDLDPDDVRNYCPISNLIFLSKVIERIVASQLTGYLQASSVVWCLWIGAGLDRIFHPASKSISQLQWSNLCTVTDAIWRAARISPGTTLVHPLHRRCDINRYITRHWGPLVRRQQPTLPTLPLHQPIDCCNEIGGMHQKCRAVDAIKSAEVELRQDPIHVAWVQTTAGKDRDREHANRRTLHQILNLRKESGSDFRSRTEDGPACQQYNKKLLLPVEAAAIHPTIAHNGSHEDIGPFPRIKSRGLLQQHSLRSHERCPAKVAIHSQRGGQADHEHNEIWPHHAVPVLRDQLHWLPIRQRIIFKIATFIRNSLHGRGPTYLSRSCIPISVIGARAHLCSAPRGHLTTPRTRTCRFGPKSFRVSGPAVWNSLPEDIANPELSMELFKTGLKTHLFRLAYMPSSAHSAYVTWLRGA